MSSNPGTHPRAEAPRPTVIVAPQAHADGPLRAADSIGVQDGRRRELTPEEFGQRFSRSWRILWCAAASVVRDRSMAQDIVQQAAVVALQRLDEFDAETNFVSWMIRIVKNLALNESRKMHRRRTTATDAATLDESVDGRRSTGRTAISGRGEVYSDQGAFDDDVLKALDGLEEVARGCLLLRVVLDLPYREIALALDIPEGTAASHVHRARKFLRDQLRHRFTGEPGSEICGDPS